MAHIQNSTTKELEVLLQGVGMVTRGMYVVVVAIGYSIASVDLFATAYDMPLWA